MGDRTTVFYRMTGTISHTVAGALVELIKEHDGTGWNLATGKLADASRETVGFNWQFDDVNYGNLDEIEEFAVEHGLGYVKRWEAGGGYGEGIAIRSADGTQVETGALEGEPVLSKAEFDAFNTADTTDDNVVAAIERFFARYDTDQGDLIVLPATEAELAEAGDDQPPIPDMKERIIANAVQAALDNDADVEQYVRLHWESVDDATVRAAFAEL